MKRFAVLFIAVTVGAALFVSGCGQKAAPTASSNDAIQKSQALQTVSEKAKYLVGQANAFMNSKNYDQAISVAKYILSNVDSNSAEAKSILQKATELLKAEAAKAMDSAKTDLQNKLGSFGK
ncbi:MAG TPA: hypothetical protein PLV09_01120 [Candidatus Omnitrophota bacterium]|nr:hypothetical protein [Candidatus Omnitrophota bacterium]MDD5738021.1 hypothetical protein [Candidatus Omnitrophota bacterium]HOX09671.1 hypothetical protein [Candidatus Omnitrophota bacterium]HPN66001.1 hypothetical protein [Candidatus Omnitrophota bacterium]HRZ66924.1 hypothetical protein [Candidatus Omnitrophota bacterium]